jgi:hypothetical protein
VVLNERGYEISTSQPTMYSADPFYKTIETSNKPISTCLLDQMKNDANFSNKNPRIGDEGKDLTDIDKVFETLKLSKESLNVLSSVQDVTQFLEKASNILQRTINIVDLKGGEQVFKFQSAKTVQAEPYHLCFAQIYSYVSDRGWLSITSKNVQNTLATQMEPAHEENEPDLKKPSGFSRVLKFFRK